MDNQLTTSVIPNSISNIFDKSLIVSNQVKERNQQFIYALGGNNQYSPSSNSVIRFQLTNAPNNMIDLRELSATFQIGTSGTGGTYRRMSSGIQSIISRFRILLGNVVITDINEYNLLYNVYLQSEQPDALATTFHINEGLGSTVERDAYALQPNKTYSINLAYISDFFKNVLVPNMTDPLLLELYLSPSNNCMESDQADVAYTVNNVQLHFTTIEIGDQLAQAFNKADRDGLIQYTYSNWSNYISMLTTATQNINLNIPLKKQVVSGIVNVNRVLSENTDITVDNKFLNWQNALIYDSSRYKLNSTYYPQDRVQSISEAYNNFCELFDKNYTQPVQIGLCFDTECFVLAQSFQKHLERYDGEDVKFHQKNLLISGANLNSGSSSLLFEVTYTAGLPSNQSASFFMKNFAILKIKNGRAELIE